MKIIFDSSKEKDAFAKFFKKLVLHIENALVASDTPEKPELSFDDWWTVWPKKIDRKAAEIKWRRLNDKEKEFAMLAARKLNRDVGRGVKELQYVMGPAKYLLNKRWEDLEDEGASQIRNPVYAATASNKTPKKQSQESTKPKEPVLTHDQSLQKLQEFMQTAYTPKDLSKDESQDNNNE